MFSIVKTALAAVIVLGSVSLGAAQALAAQHHRHARYAQPEFRSHDVSLPSTMVSPAEEQWFDRATQSFGAGG
jgi:hypothetical protein